MRRAFFYHYNKPASASAGKPQITLHYKQTCLIVDNIDVQVPTKGRLRKRQPRFVVTGKCSSVEIIDNVAIVK